MKTNDKNEKQVKDIYKYRLIYGYTFLINYFENRKYLYLNLIKPTNCNIRKIALSKW